MRKKIEYCKKTGKFRYSSEAKATRALNRYEDIKRIYFCESCNGFHTTKMGIGLAVQEGLIKQPVYTEYSPEHIQKEITRLTEKLNKENN